MVHLSNAKGVSVAVFYSALTYFIAPMLISKIDLPKQLKDIDDPCLIGFIAGFVVSILLWIFVGKHYVYSK
jgi:hypothetical protein